jgi:C-terminal processing protease CtpA/Prc
MKDGKLNIEEIVEKVSDESMQKGGNQKKIMIIDTDDTQMDGAADSVSVNVEVKEIGDGAKKKIVIKTIKDGKEEVQEILMDAEDGENIIKEGGMEKRIMILDSKDGEIKNMDSEEDIQVFVKELSDGDRDSIQVRVEYNDDGEDNFTWFSKDEMEFPAPKVRMGVMLDESVVIDGIVEGSVAEAAGLQKGDKILKIDKQVIYSVNGLLEHLTSYDEGDKAKITFERNGEQMTKKIQF